MKHRLNNIEIFILIIHLKLTLFFSFIDLFELDSFDSFTTFTKTTVVIRRRLDKSSRDPVVSDFNGTFSAIPPVKSLKPSNVVPYFNASYDPWSLEWEDNTGFNNARYSHWLNSYIVKHPQLLWMDLEALC